MLRPFGQVARSAPACNSIKAVLAGPATNLTHVPAGVGRGAEEERW
jgi:hypothetical protein